MSRKEIVKIKSYLGYCDNEVMIFTRQSQIFQKKTFIMLTFYLLQSVYFASIKYEGRGELN